MGGKHMSKRNACKYYDGCSAPLCPMLSEEENQKYIWYPDEEICTSKKNIPDWVKQQRKIAKKANSENCCHYFTLDMLNVGFRVTDSVKGLNPNIGESLQLERWFKKNKGTKRRKISDELREQKRQLIAKAREIKKQQQLKLPLEMESAG